MFFFGYKIGFWRVNYLSISEFPKQGIDVSHHQNIIKWKDVPRDYINFAYIKASEGGDFKDPKFSYNWAEAKKAGFEIGAYHFFTLCKLGVAQANNFIDIVPIEDKSLSPVVDLEFVGNCSTRPLVKDFEKELSDYIIAIEAHYNQNIILYTTVEFFNSYIKGTAFENHPIWIRSVWQRPNLKVFPNWVMWQYADNAKVNGIDTLVDLNIMR